MNKNRKPRLNTDGGIKCFCSHIVVQMCVCAVAYHCSRIIANIRNRIIAHNCDYTRFLFTNLPATQPHNSVNPHLCGCKTLRLHGCVLTDFCDCKTARLCTHIFARLLNNTTAKFCYFATVQLQNRTFTHLHIY